MISYEPPKQEAFGVGDYIEGLGTVFDPDDEEMVAFMEGTGKKDDTRETSMDIELKGAELLRRLIFEKKKKEVERLKRELGINECDTCIGTCEERELKDDTDYINGSSEPHAHLNACGTGELTVFINPSKVTTLTFIGDETRHYDLTDRGAGFDEERYRRVCQLLEETLSLMSEWGCNELPDMRNRL